MGDLESTAIARLQEAARLSEFYYQKPLLLTYSGGKDSEVCLELCKRAGVPFEVIHSLTTADAPETVYHVRKVFRRLELEGVKCEILHPRYKGRPTSMWSLIPAVGCPPIRTMRYCCSHLKEGNGAHRCVVLGVRRAESTGRRDSGTAELHGKIKKSKVIFDMDNGDERIIAPCQVRARIKFHPIVDWKDSDVWSFLRSGKTEVCPVYKMGMRRVGCIGCPMAAVKERYKSFRIWPKYKALYMRAFERMLDKFKANGTYDNTKYNWRSSDAVFRWWMDDKNLDGQLNIDGWEE